MINTLITTHVAGIQIVLGKLQIQRCIICGEALILNDLSKMMRLDNEVGLSWFETGSFVEVELNEGCKRISIVGTLPLNFKVEELPETICTDLIEI